MVYYYGGYVKMTFDQLNECEGLDGLLVPHLTEECISEEDQSEMTEEFREHFFLNEKEEDKDGNLFLVGRELFSISYDEVNPSNQPSKPNVLSKEDKELIDRLIPNAGYIWMPDDCGCCT